MNCWQRDKLLTQNKEIGKNKKYDEIQLYTYYFRGHPNSTWERRSAAAM